MNSKSENNKYDIVSEAEAVLEAYARRCRSYTNKTEKRKRSRSKIIFWMFFVLGMFAVLLYWGICM